MTWVHPSWRDLVIEALARDTPARRRFLERCGVDGAALALSAAGGAEGERRRPLLREDADWDALADGLHHLCGELDEPDAVRLLGVLAETEANPETCAVAALVAARLAVRWRGRAVGVDALIAWTTVAAGLDDPPEPPSSAATWIELEPAAAPETPAELERFADWLRLAELLRDHDPALLRRLGFPQGHQAVLGAFAAAAPRGEPPLEQDVRLQALDRLARLVPEYESRAHASSRGLTVETFAPAPDPPRIFPPASRFPIARVLRDLVD